jgi:hypothetical protein
MSCQNHWRTCAGMMNLVASYFPLKQGSCGQKLSFLGVTVGYHYYINKYKAWDETIVVM